MSFESEIMRRFAVGLLTAAIGGVSLVAGWVVKTTYTTETRVTVIETNYINIMKGIADIKTSMETKK